MDFRISGPYRQSQAKREVLVATWIDQASSHQPEPFTSLSRMDRMEPASTGARMILQRFPAAGWHPGQVQGGHQPGRGLGTAGGTSSSHPGGWCFSIKDGDRSKLCHGGLCHQAYMDMMCLEDDMFKSYLCLIARIPWYVTHCQKIKAWSIWATSLWDVGQAQQGTNLDMRRWGILD